MTAARPTAVYNAISANDSVRGVERYHLGVLPALAGLGSWRIVVLRAPWQSYYEPLADRAGLELATVAPPRSRLQRGLWQLVDGGLRGLAPDLVHLGNVIPAPVGIGAPLVAMVHDVIEFRSGQSYDPVRRWARRRLVGRLARRSRAMVTVAEETAADLESLLGRPAGSVVPVGIGIEPAPAPAPVPAADRDRAIVFVGALDPHKRLDVVVDALARVPGLELRIVSAGGPAEPGLRARADRLGVAGRVRWAGRLPDRETRELVARSAALIMASDLEGFGIPVLEALQASTPVVISEGVPLAAEWRRHGGPVFAAGDPAGLAAALAGFLADPSRRDELAAAGPRLAARFTWPSVATRLEAVWRSALEAPAAGR